MKYSKEEWLEKYKDPQWQKKRLYILERDLWCCQACYSPDKTLHVHHRYYLENKEPWEYPDEALVTLCEECHIEEGEDRRCEEQKLLRCLREKFLLHEIIELTAAIYNMPILQAPELVMSAYCWALKNDCMQRKLIKLHFEFMKKQRAKRFKK